MARFQSLMTNCNTFPSLQGSAQCYILFRKSKFRYLVALLQCPRNSEPFICRNRSISWEKVSSKTSYSMCLMSDCNILSCFQWHSYCYFLYRERRCGFPVALLHCSRILSLQKCVHILKKICLWLNWLTLSLLVVIAPLSFAFSGVPNASFSSEK